MSRGAGRAVLGVAGLLLAGLCTALPGEGFAQTQLLNASYDVAREFYREYNPLFESDWLMRTGQSVHVSQSHDGSSKQARAVIDGLAADVVTMNQGIDLEALADHGMVAPDWSQRFPDGAAPTYSTMLLLVRHGNPKGIKDWDDLARPGIQVIIVNPKTGGNGRYSYLAMWGYAKKHGASDPEAAQFVGSILRNVPVLESGGRSATNTFLQRGVGDVLVTFESEVIQIDREFGHGRVDVVYPTLSIRADNPVAVVVPVVAKKHDEELARAYLQFLYSEPAQELAARHFLRVRSAAVMARHADTFHTIALFSVDEVFGGWKKAQKDHFDEGAQFDRLMAASGRR
jgi:sulfate transport system substrate-binding protein